MYLTGKKVSPESVFKQAVKTVSIEAQGRETASRKKTRIIIRPDDKSKREFVDALVAQPDGVERLLFMLQASSSASDVIREIVNDLTGMGLVRLGIAASQEQLNEKALRDGVASWLDGSREKPMQCGGVDCLLLLLLYGYLSGFLDDHAVTENLLTARKKLWSATIKKRPELPLPSLLKATIAARKTELVFQAVLAYSEDTWVEQHRLESDINRKYEQIAALRETNAVLNAENSDLSGQIKTLQEEKHAAELAIASLQKQVEEIRASYQHKIDDVRGHIRGTLEGQLTRWLETSLDASRANPPRVEVIEERLEDALKLIEKELRWLQPSA